MTTDEGASAPSFSMERIQTAGNRPPEQVRANIISALARRLPEVHPLPEHRNGVTLIGSAPSVAKHIPDIARQRERGDHISCVNAAHDWLIERKIVPDFCVLLDASEYLHSIVTPHPDVIYFVASQCHPSVFDRLSDNTVMLWNALVPPDDVGGDFGDLIAAQPGELTRRWLVPGGGTAMLRSFNLFKMHGYRTFTAFGLDSSYADDGSHHVTPNAVSTKMMDVEYAGRSFVTNIQFASQAQDFEASYLSALDDCRINVIGDGLIPWICETLNREKFGVAA